MIIYVFVAGVEEGALSAASELIGSLYLAPDSVDLLLQDDRTAQLGRLWQLQILHGGGAGGHSERDPDPDALSRRRREGAHA